MTLALAEPSATADVVEQADYVELMALQAADHNASIADFISDVNTAGTAELFDIDTADGFADPEDDSSLVDRGGEVLQAVGNGVMAEIEGREVACGGAYPFVLDNHGVLTLKPGRLKSTYIFMLLVTRFGGRPKVGRYRASTIDATKLFEELAEVAAAEYFGWDGDHVLVYPFGFPRKMTPKGFEDAVNDLCRLTKEGIGCRRRPNLADQKDATLDVVVVRRFPDRRIGQLMGFGQCATGADWRDKLTELQPHTFCKLWMLEMPAVDPVRLFFVPHTIEEKLWLQSTMSAGVVFDRCRVAYQVAHRHDDGLMPRIGAWVEDIITKLVIR